MPRARSAIGDLVRHKDGGDTIFIIENWFEPADENDAQRLYQCSITRLYDFG